MVVKFDSQIRQMESVSKRIDYSLWAMLEITTAIICANLFPLTALWRHMKAKLHNYKQKKNGLTVSKTDTWISSGVGVGSGGGADSGTSKLLTHSVIRRWFNRSVQSRYNPWVRYGVSHESTSQMDLSKEKRSGSKISENEVLSSPSMVLYSPHQQARAGSYDSIGHRNFNSFQGHSNSSSRTIYPEYHKPKPSGNNSYSAFPFPAPSATTIAIGTAMTTPAADRSESPLMLPIMGTRPTDDRSDQDISLGAPRQEMSNDSTRRTGHYSMGTDDIV